MTADYLWSECRSGKAFLVIVTQGKEILAASVWRFEAWSTGCKLRCLGMYGTKMKQWLEDHRAFTLEMARVGGATSLVTDGRLGWERIFPQARILRQTYEIEI